RAAERGKPAPDESHSAIPHGALVPDAALREFNGRLETLARESDDRRRAPAACPAPSRDGADGEGGGSRVARCGAYQRLEAFTGRKGLDQDRSSSTGILNAA